MYRYLLCILLSFSVLRPGIAGAKEHKNVTAHYKVDGVCEQCKKRIEAACYIKGVKYAEWNADTHDLTIKYDSTKTNPDEILKSITKTGHDAGNFRALDEDYNKLPKCCKYRDGAKMP